MTSATAPPATIALEARNIDAGYGQIAVLRQVSLQVRAGAVVALLGPNGAGKTTLLRVLAGLLNQTNGDVFLEGTDVSSQRSEERARRGLCLIPEGRGIFRNLTVRENLDLFRPRWVEDRSIDRALEAFPVLRTRLTERAGNLSGGQQQMLALSRCFLARPKIALVDEVSLGLAPQAVDAIFEALSTIVAQGVALLLVEQYVDRALDIAQSVHVLNRGQINYSGAARDVDANVLIERYLGQHSDVSA
jgi:branched-chain amino acid transport system ATP-binding protein